MKNQKTVTTATKAVKATKAAKSAAKPKVSDKQAHIIRRFAGLRAHTNPTFQKKRSPADRKGAVSNLLSFVRQHPFLRARLAKAS